MAIVTEIEEDNSQEITGACSRGRGELLNLECSINFDSMGASTRQGKGKASVFLPLNTLCGSRV